MKPPRCSVGRSACFAEVNGRRQAEALRGTVLTVASTALPPLAEGEYYHAELIGLAAVTDAGAALGTTIAVHNFGATDIVEIALDPPPDKGQKTIMVPVIPQAVITWDETRLVISEDFADQ